MLVRARLVGVIEAEQTEEGATKRNDRLIAVAEVSPTHRDVRTLDDLEDALLDEVEHFSASYHEAEGEEFASIGRGGPARAERLVREAMK